MSDGYQVLAKMALSPASGSSTVGPPGSSATITLFDSTTAGALAARSRGLVFEKVILNLLSSHASATDGVIFEVSTDRGANWESLITYTNTPGGTLFQRHVVIGASDFRIRYTNSANALTAWRGSLIGERSA